MVKVAHIINPFNASESSDLHFAQPITFRSMEIAKEQVKGRMDVTLMSAQFLEDRNMIPASFKSTQNLDRSVLDCSMFDKPMKLPILDDIIRRMYDESDADYLIYTNVDIGLYPKFYDRVLELVEQGHDAFIINRKRIPTTYTKLEELDKIITLKGKKHPGFDCFVFKRELYPRMVLKEVCIGVPFIGITLSQNLFALAEDFILITDEKLTFHIGMEIMKGRAPREYFKYNQREFWKAMNSELKFKLSSKKIPYSNYILPFRLIRWGLHPSIPIRLMLRLEYERFLNYFKKSNSVSASENRD